MMAAYGVELPPVPGHGGQVWFATSGSSGVPKWLALPKDGLLLSAAAVNAHLGVDETSCWGLALPLHHVGGFGVVARAYEAGCQLTSLGGRWDPVRFCRWLDGDRVTHTSLVPTQVHDLVAAGLRAPAALRAVVVGGGRLDEPVGEAARRLGWPVLASYGLTEASSQVATQPLSALAGTYRCGPLEVLPIWRARVGGDGCLQIAGPALYQGVLRWDASAWRYHRREGEWHRTADRVELNDGWLSHHGRADTVVKVLGELVDPAAIEAELGRLAGGALREGTFAIAAVPDARAGHRLVPVVERSVDGAVVLAALAAYQQTAPGYRRLAGVVRVDALPRSPLGKLRRGELAALAVGKA